MAKLKFRKMFAVMTFFITLAVISILNISQAKAAGSPPITVTSPNGGETWKVGETHRITWTSVGVQNVTMYLYDNRISSSGAIVNYPVPDNQPIPASQGYYDWTILPNVLQANDGTNFQIIVQDASNYLLSGKSSAPFKIVAADTPSVTVISPNGGETWRVGETHRITWTSVGVEKVTMYLYDNRISSSGAIVNYPVPDNQSISASQGYYDWKILPNVLQANDGTNFQIIVQDASNYLLSGESRAPFKIVAAGTPSITVTSPNGGETWAIGKTYDISWSSAGLKGKYIDIRLDLDNPNFGAGLDINLNVLADLGKYSWTVPSMLENFDLGVSGNKYKIELMTHKGDPYAYDYSDNYFSIVAASTACTDSDGGKNYYVKGTTDDGITIGDDVCDFTILKERYCDAQSKFVTESYTCPNGCKDGACVVATTACTDSDGGKNYYVKGTTDDGITIGDDVCDFTILKERYCDAQSKFVTESYTCPNGCKDGACLGKPDLTVISPSGGEKWVKGTSQNITWNSSGGISAVDILLSECTLSPCAYSFIAKNIPNNGTYIWNAGILISGGGLAGTVDIGKYKIQVREKTGEVGGEYKYDESDNYFSIVATKLESPKDEQVIEIDYKAKLLNKDEFSTILVELRELRDIVKEQAARIKYLEKLTKDVERLSAKMENAINNFITYGVDENTQKLGEGERAAVMYSYKSAFDKLPETEAELADAIKIANGRWPSITNDEAEKKAKEQFQKIYHRIADMNNANDNAAVTVMAYGLRQKAENRNLNSEKQGIKIFKNIYGHTPKSTEDWNIMQAITYSGSTRGVDSDGDLLTDQREAELGTDPNNKDTDGDGYIDGIEVANGHDPLNK